MGRRSTCKTCRHPDVAAINRELRHGGEPRAAVAQRWGLTESAIRRHHRCHLAGEVTGEREAREFSADLGRLVRESASRMRLAERRGKIAEYERAWDQHRTYLELLARALRLLSPSEGFNAAAPRYSETPEKAKLPAGRPRGGALKQHGGQLVTAEDWDGRPEPLANMVRSHRVDPYAEARRLRAIQLRRLGISDRIPEHGRPAE